MSCDRLRNIFRRKVLRLFMRVKVLRFDPAAAGAKKQHRRD